MAIHFCSARRFQNWRHSLGHQEDIASGMPRMFRSRPGFLRPKASPFSTVLESRRAAKKYARRMRYFPCDPHHVWCTQAWKGTLPNVSVPCSSCRQKTLRGPMKRPSVSSAQGRRLEVWVREMAKGRETRFRGLV